MVHHTGGPVGLRGGAEHRLGGTQDPERCREVHIQDGVPLLVGHLLYDVVPGVPGVVDHDVETTELSYGRGDEPLGERRFGNAAGAHGSPPASGPDLLDDVPRRLHVEVVDDHAGALAGQEQCDAAADTTTGAADNGSLAMELSHRCCAPSG